MDYIKDKTLFKAVNFSRSLIRNGRKPALANSIAAKYYKVSIKDVAHHVGKVAAKVRWKRK